MWWKLLLAMTLIPAAELFLLLQLGSFIGPTPTFLILLLTGVLGAYLAKREGLAVLRELSAELQRGLPPADRLAEGALVLIGGLLLITPGVLTDFTGLLILVPAIRRRLAPRLMRSLAASFAIEEPAPPGEGVRYHRAPQPRSEPKATPFSTPFD